MDNDNFRAEQSKAKQAACRTHKRPHTLTILLYVEIKGDEKRRSRRRSEDEDEDARDESTEEERRSPRIC